MNQIEVSPGGVQALSTNVQNLSTEVNSAEESMAIVVNGDTAPKAISKGQYLFIKNHSTLATGGYHATAAIASGANVAGSVSADANGICNDIQGSVASLLASLTTIQSGLTTSQLNSGKVRFFEKNVSGWNATQFKNLILSLPEGDYIYLIRINYSGAQSCIGYRYGSGGNCYSVGLCITWTGLYYAVYHSSSPSSCGCWPITMGSNIS